MRKENLENGKAVAVALLPFCIIATIAAVVAHFSGHVVETKLAGIVAGVFLLGIVGAFICGEGGSSYLDR